MPYFIIEMSQRLSLPNQIKRWKRLWTEQQVEIARLKGLLEEIENEGVGLVLGELKADGYHATACGQCVHCQAIAAKAKEGGGFPMSPELAEDVVVFSPVVERFISEQIRRECDRMIREILAKDPPNDQ